MESNVITNDALLLALKAQISDEDQDNNATCNQIVTEILRQRITILKFVELLEDLLTDVNEFKRSKGTKIYAEVLSLLPKDYLSEKEILFIVAFFCDRIKDHFVVTPPALQGLLAVAQMSNLSDECPVTIMTTLSQHLTCQTLPQPSRFLYYSIYEAFTQTKMKVLEGKPTEFIYAVISAMESESDPRNLMLLFSFLPALLRLPLSHLAEETFSVLECYFPVDFTPRAEGDITRDDLAQRLEDCLTATHEFGLYCIPMLLGKLDSRLKVAHLDSLKVMIRGSKIWPLGDINPHLRDIWLALRKLILTGSDVETAELAVSALSAVLQVYARSPLDASQASNIAQLFNDVTASTHGFLSDASLNLFGSAMKLLIGVSQASRNSCYHIVTTVVMQLCAHIEVDNNHYDTVLSSLRPILKSATNYKIWQTKEDKVRDILAKVSKVLSQSVKKPTAKSGSFLCLSEIVEEMTVVERLTVYDYIVESLPHEHPRILKDSCAVFVKKAANLYPDEIRIHLLSKLPIPEEQNSAGDNNQDIPSEAARRTVETFCWACDIPELTPYAVTMILKYIEHGSNLTIISLESLRAFSETADCKIVRCLAIECKLPENLLIVFLEFCSKPTKYKAGELLCGEEVLSNVANIVDLLIKPLSASEQSEIISKCFSMLFGPEINNISLPSEVPVQKVILLEGLLRSLRSEVPLPAHPYLTTSLILWSVSGTTQLAKISVLHLLASIINKHSEGEELDCLLNNMLEEKVGSGDSATPQGTLLCGWITKALVLRAHPHMLSWINRLISLLTVESVQQDAVDGFKLILSDSIFLKSSSHCNIKILYKQRMFQKIDDLISLYEVTEGKNRIAVSMVIAYLLHSAPRPLLLERLPQLVKIIVSCLESEDMSVIESILEVLNSLLEAQEEVIVKYIDTFLPRFIEKTQASKMDVRIQALNCIYNYGRFKDLSIASYKNLVVTSLAKCLDDKKRLVRQKAVRARNRWFLLSPIK